MPMGTWGNTHTIVKEADCRFSSPASRASNRIHCVAIYVCAKAVAIVVLVLVVVVLVFVPVASASDKVCHSSCWALWESDNPWTKTTPAIQRVCKRSNDSRIIRWHSSSSFWLLLPIIVDINLENWKWFCSDHKTCRVSIWGDVCRVVVMEGEYC